MVLSKGNMKIGKMANVSLSPKKSCGEAAEHCGKDCYSAKAYRMWPAVIKAWDHNYLQATTDLEGFFQEIHDALKKYKGKFFRWHVAGDILSTEYFSKMTDLADDYPNIKFLVFTKQYAFVNTWVHYNGQEYLDGRGPVNLQVVFSAWPGLPMENPYDFPVAFMQDGTETRVTGEEIECPGSCEGCGMCWSLDSIGKSVVFHKH